MIPVFLARGFMFRKERAACRLSVDPWLDISQRNGIRLHSHAIKFQFVLFGIWLLTFSRITPIGYKITIMMSVRRILGRRYLILHHLPFKFVSSGSAVN